MVYEDEIAQEEVNISNLIRQRKAARLPPRTINWQFQNARTVQPRITQNVLLSRRIRIGLNNQIISSHNKIRSLREAIFNRDNEKINII